MAVFKCKMCGGALEIAGNESVAVCEYCGTKQTLPKLEDEKRANLYDRANHFRRNNEFDKAMGIYEQILNADTTDSEAYWSLVLCRYGIEYVEDPASRKRVPTVNRAQYTSILADEDYKAALQYADSYQKEVYEAEAVAIDKIQKGILEISQKEEPFDVFICYKETDNNGRRTPDSVLANDLYHQLTQEGFKVFFARITLEDKLGSAYEPYIFAALNSAKVMVVLGTKPEFFNAVWVKNEWSRYLGLIKNGAKKVLIPAYRDMDPYDLPEEFSHLQAQDMSKLGFMQDLIRGIKKLTAVEAPTVVEKQVVVTNAGEGMAGTAALIKRAFLFLEDGDWDSADDYCEKVLDIDPECAKAYVGKMLAELELHKEADLIEYKDASVITENTDYQKACRFADDKYRAVLKGYVTENIKKKELQKKEAVYKTAMDYISAAQTSKSKDYYEIYLRAAEQFEKIPGYKDADEKHKECLDAWKTERSKTLYTEAMLLIKNAAAKSSDTIHHSVYLEAASLLEQIPNYEDAANQRKMWLEKAESLKKEEIYTNALWHEKDFTKETEEIQIKHLKEAIKNYQQIPGYKDADERKEECERKIEHLNLQKTKKEENRAKRLKIAELAIMMIIVLGVLVAIIVNSWILPAIKYKEAVVMLEAGQYEEAYTGFEEVLQYKDSKEKRTLIEAVYELQKGNNGNAIRQLLKNGTTVRLEYDADGGVQVASGYVYNELSEFGELEETEKNGYRFDGWNCESAKYDVDKDEMAILLKANWTAITYSIDYQLDGGVIADNSRSTYTIESNDITLINPTRENYFFLGWTGEDNAAPVLLMTIPAGSYGDKVFTAHWEPITFTITLDANGGSLSKTEVKASNVEEWNLPVPKRDNYEFVGWYDNTGHRVYPELYYIYNRKDDLTLTAKWKWSPAEYTIKYDLGGVKATHANSSSVTFGSVPTLAPAVATGYKFLGWYTDKEYTQKIDKISDDLLQGTGITLYAKWELITYSIEYDLAGGKSDGNLVMKFTVKNLPVTLPNVTRENYEFAGWYVSENTTKSYTSWNETKNVTFIAKWEPVGYELKYDLSGVEATHKNPTSVTIESVATSLKPATATGYKFLGWYTDKECTKKVDKISKDLMQSAGTTLYAKWEQITYTIEYHLEGGTTTETLVKKFTVEDLPLKLPIPEKNDFVFTGWSNEVTGIGLMDNIDTCKDYSLYANYVDDKLVMVLSKDEKSWIVDGYNGSKSTVQIPAEYGKYGRILPVKEIAAKAFYRNEIVKEIIIAEGVESIGNEAFGYSTLSKIRIPGSVISIGQYAFSYSDLQEVTLTKGLQSIGAYAFSHTAISKMDIPDSVTSIGDYAFYNCKKLTEIVLPKGITYTGTYILNGCSNLKKITVPFATYKVSLGQLFHQYEHHNGFVVLDELIVSGGTTICNSFASITRLVTEKIVFPEGLLEIQSNAVYCGNMKEVYIPASVTSIDDSAFFECCDDFTIITTPGAYAETYALKKGYQIKYK